MKKTENHAGWVTPAASLSCSYQVICSAVTWASAPNWHIMKFQGIRSGECHSAVSRAWNEVVTIYIRGLFVTVVCVFLILSLCDVGFGQETCWSGVCPKTWTWREWSSKPSPAAPTESPQTSCKRLHACWSVRTRGGGKYWYTWFL